MGVIDNVLLKNKRLIVVFLIKITGVVSLFCVFKLINYFVGEREFGVFSLCFTFSQMCIMFGNFGVSTYVLKEISKKDEIEKNKPEALQIYWNKFGGLLISGVIIAFLGYFSSSFISDYIFKKPELSEYIAAICLSIPFVILSNLNSQVLRAFNKYYSFQFLFGVASFLIFLILILTAAATNNINLMNIIYAFNIACILTMILSLILVKKSKIRLKLNISFSNYIEGLKKGFDFFIAQFSSQAFNWISIFLLTYYSVNMDDVGALNIILRISSLALIIIMVVNNVAGPNYSNLFHKNDILELNKQVKKNTKKMFFVTLPLLLILFIFPEFFLTFFSENYGKYTLAFRFVLVGYFFNLICGSSGLLMQMINEQKMFRNIQIITLIIHFVIGFFLLDKFKNLTGLTLSIFVCMVIWNLWTVLYLYKKHKVKSLLIIKS